MQPTSETTTPIPVSEPATDYTPEAIDPEAEADEPSDETVPDPERSVDETEAYGERG